MSVNAKSAPILPNQLSWASAIGNFLLNFGALDYFIQAYLKDNLPPAEFSKITNEHFNDRLSRVAEHLRGTVRAETREIFETLLTRVTPIRIFRNHIAHGYLVFKLNVEAQTWELSITVPKNLDQEYSPEAKHVTFDQLNANLTELNSLIEAFKKVVGFEDLQ